MDFTTLKRRVESGAVSDVDSLVSDLNLIFDNAMIYNGKGTDYYRMAQTLKDVVRFQQTNYMKWRQEHGGQLGGGNRTVPPAAAAAAAVPAAPAAPAAPVPAEEPAPAAKEDADADAPVRRGGRRGARS